MQHGTIPYIATIPCILIIPYFELNRKELSKHISRDYTSTENVS